jgi:hypothetical protein
VTVTTSVDWFNSQHVAVLATGWLICQHGVPCSGSYTATIHSGGVTSIVGRKPLLYVSTSQIVVEVHELCMHSLQNVSPGLYLADALTGSVNLLLNRQLYKFITFEWHGLVM